MSTVNDYNFKVDIEDCGLCQNFMFAELYWLICLKSTKKSWFIRSTLIKLGLNVDLNTDVIFCQP